MLILPAIDIRNGRCVRLLQGRQDRETVYGDDPAGVARRWVAAGASFLHVVDLDGAFTGNPRNRACVRDIVHAVPAPVQLGGGIRSLDDVERMLDLGVARVILGTAAVTDPGLVEAAIRRRGAAAVLVGIDARDGRAAVRGWASASALTAEAVARRVKEGGVERIVYTDIARDGMMTGPNVDATRAIARATGLRVIASGGVSSMEDLAAVAAGVDDGIEGVIVGKALYEGALDLGRAVARFSGAAPDNPG